MGLRTILEERRLSTNGVIDWYLEVWVTLKFHNFQHFNHNSGLVHLREFYEAYAKAIPKSKSTLKIIVKPLNGGGL